jgi:general secretion pathway protein G
MHRHHPRMARRGAVESPRSCAGFTLLELLAVMVIIGLLAGIVGPRLFGNVSKSEVTTAKAQIDVLGKALDQFRLDMGRYPTNQEGLAALMVPTAGDPRWRGPYLRKDVPADPWGMPYQYRYPSSKQADDFELLSFGRDKLPGGDGDNADIGR